MTINLIIALLKYGKMVLVLMFGWCDSLSQSDDRG